MDTPIKYWTQGASVRNFGDDLSQLIANNVLLSPRIPGDVYRIIGSVIDDDIIFDDIKDLSTETRTVVYWCCGKRNDTKMGYHAGLYSRIFGARGPLTRDVLELPHETALGDTALLIPLFHEARTVACARHKTLCIPHFTQTIETDRLLEMSGADLALTSEVRSDQEALDLIDAIVSSDFVLTGALHVAIIACAYGRPFAFWDTGFVDIPFKWHDFAASIGIPAEFVTDLEQGRAYYDRVKADIRPPKLVPMLECCPFHVRPSVMRAARDSDARL